jgi:hypothetical protein
MNRHLYRIAAASLSAAIALGFAGTLTRIAYADVPTSTPATIQSVPQTDPPGPCTADEIGQTKLGPDGNLYIGLPENNNPGAFTEPLTEGGSGATV